MRKASPHICRPVFILGNPRSGTTLLRVIINAHRDIVIPPECGFALWLYDKYKDEDFKKPRVLNAYLSDLLETKKFATWRLAKKEIFAYLSGRIETGSYAEIVDLIYRCYAHRISKKIKRWGDKNNFYIDYIPRIIALYPQAQFIHIARDVRDVACSYIELADRQINSRYKPLLPANVGEIARQWLNNNQKIEHGLRNLDSRQKMTVRYEDLVQQTEEITKEITCFLGLEHNRSMLEYHRHATDEPEEFLQWKQKIVEKPSSSSIGRYSSELTTLQISEIEALAGSKMMEYGY